MKKIIFLLLLPLVTTKAFAQTFTADEMIAETKCKTFDCINDLLVKKKLHLYYKNDMHFCMAYAFDAGLAISNLSASAAKIIYNVSVSFYNKSTFPDRESASIFTTVNGSYFSELKKDFLSKGFHYKEEHNSDSPNGDELYKDVVSTYKSPNYPEITLNISTSLKKGKDGSKWTEYGFELRKSR